MVTTEDACRSHLLDVIRRNKLEKFYPVDSDNQLLQDICREAPRHLKEWGEYAVSQGVFDANECKEYQFSMLTLALYDIHILLDNSHSMYEVHEVEDENGQTQWVPRKDTAKTLLANIVDLDSKIVEQGVKLHYLNDGDAPVLVKNEAELQQAFEFLRFHGNTKLGTVVENKIWSKIIRDRSNFTKPCLVYIITDGQPVGEPKTTFKNSILRCKNVLEEAGYASTAIAFGIAQVGDDEGARDFLEELHLDPQLKDHLDVVNEDEKAENKYRDLHQAQGFAVEEAHALVLELLVGAIEH